MMNAKIAWGISMFVFLPLVTGCMQSTGVVRGQSPGYQIEQPRQPIQTVRQTNYIGHPTGHSCPTCQSGFPSVQQSGSLPFQHVLSHGANNAGDEHGHHPTHHHWFSYEQPRNLVYPPANQPAAVVQYPYYTLKGPDDFFLK